MCADNKKLCSYKILLFLFWQYNSTNCAPEGSLITDYTTNSIVDDVTIVSRKEWGARPPSSTRPLAINPPPFIVIHHSASDSCYTDDNCTKRVVSIQNYHMDHNEWEDIGYNFLIGGNGEIFEGRGWGIHGAHCPVFNKRSIGICLLGNFVSRIPTDEQLQATKHLIAFAVRNSFVVEDYHLVGHRQGSRTECPGQKLFKEIVKWPRYDPNNYHKQKMIRI